LKNTKAFLLAAGIGSRLRPFTDNWPKCLMPIQGRPLLEYWLSLLHVSGIDDILINVHHHAEIVHDFINRPQYKNWVQSVYEPELLGTAGSIRKNSEFLSGNTILLIHADNLCCCNFREFLDYHHTSRPNGTVMTMMTFESSIPKTCGIVELDKQGVVKKFHEKVENPPGNLANAAVYLIEKEVFEFILNNPGISDFSTEVLPKFIGEIATWKNKGVLRDIGTPEMLKKAQKDSCQRPTVVQDDWNKAFYNNPIHTKIYP